jgi:hypothetical protein
MKRRTVTYMLAGLAGIIVVGGALVRFESYLTAVIVYWCPVDERWDYVVPGNGGYTMSHFLRSCPFNPFEAGVSAERSRFPWQRPERELVFHYPDGGSLDIISTGNNTVTISIESVSEVFRAKTSWGTLRIDYNIGSIDNPRPGDPKTVGEAWADREKALVESARQHGIRTSADPSRQGTR